MPNFIFMKGEMRRMNNMNNMGTFIPQRNQFSSYFSPTQAQGAPTNNIIWVQGIEGAKAWQLNPNSMSILLDSEVEGKMYIKVSDNIGMSSLRVFDYTEVAQPSNVTVNKDLDLSSYVRKDELSFLIKEMLNEQSISTAATTTGGSATGEQQPPAAPKITYIKK